MIITIDPGTNGTGYAIWDKEWKLVAWGVLRSKKKEWEEKMEEISFKLRTKVKSYNLSKGYIEEPAKFQGTFGTMVANRGDLVKLSIFVGYIKGYIRIPVESVPVISWKGQLPKEVVIQRIKRLLPKVNAEDHSWDAIGIGLYLKGVF